MWTRKQAVCQLSFIHSRRTRCIHRTCLRLDTASSRFTKNCIAWVETTLIPSTLFTCHILPEKTLTVGESPTHSYDFNGRIRRMFESSSHPPFTPNGQCIAVWAHARNVLFCLFFFSENRELTDPAEIEQALRFGEYIKNGAHMMTTNLPSTSFDRFFVRTHRPCMLCCTARQMGNYHRDTRAVLPPQISLSETAIRHF